jgi:hypothetical protein
MPRKREGSTIHAKTSQIQENIDLRVPHEVRRPRMLDRSTNAKAVRNHNTWAYILAWMRRRFQYIHVQRMKAKKSKTLVTNLGLENSATHGRNGALTVKPVFLADLTLKEHYNWDVKLLSSTKSYCHLLRRS